MSDAPQAPRQSRAWLIVSLCLNVFLIGLIAAGLVVARNRVIAGAVRGEGSLPPEVVLQMLPPSGAVKMCDVIGLRTAAFVKVGRDLVEARRDIFKALRAEPFDAVALKSAFDRATAVQVALLQLRQTTALQVVDKLDARERRELTDRMVRRIFSGARGERVDRPSLRELCAAAGASGASQLPR